MFTRNIFVTKIQTNVLREKNQVCSVQPLLCGFPLQPKTNW